MLTSQLTRLYHLVVFLPRFFPFFLDIRQILAHTLLGDAEFKDGVLLGETPEIKHFLEDIKIFACQFRSRLTSAPPPHYPFNECTP